MASRVVLSSKGDGVDGGGGILKSLDLLNIGHQVPHDRDQASIHVAAHPYGFGSLLNVFEEVVSVGIKSCSSDFNPNLKPFAGWLGVVS